jgi:adenylate kinase family enzyme
MNQDKDKENINIIEAFIKYNKHLVIVISGLSGCGKSELSNRLARELNLTHLEQNNYLIKDYVNKVTLPNKIVINNKNTDDAINWDKLNRDIDKYATSGVLISGYALPQDKIKTKSKVDYYISLAIKKEDCMQQRIKYITKHKDKYKQEYKYIKDNAITEKLIVNLLIFPYFLSSNKRSKINKYINVTSKSQLYEDVYNDLMKHVFSQENVEKLYWDYRSKKEGGHKRI